MKIISNVKDYYDYLQKYTRVDPKEIIFPRLNLINTNIDGHFVLANGEWKDWRTISRLTNINPKTRETELDTSVLFCLAICGKYYYFDQEIVPIISYIESYKVHKRILKKYLPANENISNDLLNLHKQYNSPILMFYVHRYNDLTYDRYNFYLCNKVPLLQDFKFANIIKPEEMYQEIEWFINNYMRDNPDIKPPIIISNNDLIVSKGFDKKISFRHRV